jgi:hypothetical protein
MFQALLGPGLKMIDKLVDRIPDPAAKERASLEMQAELLKYAAEQSVAQMEVNKVEAAHSSIFVSGWRPFIGWMGGASLGYAFLLQPILAWFLTIVGVTTPLPEPNTEAMMALVTAMLGVTAARSFDKWKGTSK